MQQLFGQTLFSVADETAFYEDLIVGAMLWGDWKSLERTSRLGLALSQWAEDYGEELPEDEVDVAAAEFRYARDLISAEDAESWLEARGLTADDWMGHIERVVARARWGSRGAEALALRPPDPDELLDAIRVDLICGGELRRLALKLAEYAAACAAVVETGVPVDQPAQTPTLQVRGLEDARTAARSRAVARWMDGQRKFLARATGDQAVAQEIARHQLEWIRIDGRALIFDTEPLAREAALCVREDGMSMDEVADTARSPVQEARLYLEELDDADRTKFIAAKPNELLGPIAADGHFMLFRVLDKVMPSDADSELRQRARDRVVARALELEMERRVKWAVRW